MQRRAVHLADTLEAPRHTFEPGKGRDDASRASLTLRSKHEPGGEKRILNLKGADQRQLRLNQASESLDLQDLIEAGGAGFDKAQRRSCRASGQKLQSAQPHRRKKHIGIRPVGVDDGRRVVAEERLEEAKLSRSISLCRAVIVEMVAAEIGEAGGDQAHAVEPALIDAVGRSFHGKPRYAVPRETVEGLVERNRVRRRQRTVARALGSDHAKRAEACRRVTEGGEELACEIRNRALAARACDGNRLFGLARIEPRRREGERAAHVRHGDDGRIARQASRAFAPRDDGRGACSERLRNEAQPVRLRPGDCHERKARPDLSAVRGDPGNRNRGAGCALRLGEKIGKNGPGPVHFVPHAPSRVMSGKGVAGGSKRGGTPSSGATRSMMFPVTGPAFQPAVENP